MTQNGEREASGRFNSTVIAAVIMAIATIVAAIVGAFVGQATPALKATAASKATHAPKTRAATPSTAPLPTLPPSPVPTSGAPSPEPKITTGASAQISSPQPLGHVSTSYVAKGVIHDIPQGSSVWLVVRYSSYYWPEVMLPGGISNWQETVYFGDPAHRGQQFTLLVVLADPAADQKFDFWISATNGQARPPGLTKGSDYPHVLTLATVDVVLQ